MQLLQHGINNRQMNTTITLQQASTQLSVDETMATTIITSDQSNMEKGCIAAAHGRFNRILQSVSTTI